MRKLRWDGFRDYRASAAYAGAGAPQGRSSTIKPPANLIVFLNEGQGRIRPIAVTGTTRHSLPMKMRSWLVCIGLALVAIPAFARPSGCGLPEISGSRELHQFLSLRAVEVVKRAAGPDEGLVGLVAPSASFNLGAGDVGRPLGTGIAGARELARTMKADTYRFLGWDYMDMPADPCSKHKVEVEFIDSQGRNVSRVEFTFEAGRVVGANGWERSFETGRL